MLSSVKCLQVMAPAKINLTLRITGRRADGYHELISLMQKVELADTLHVAVGRPGIRVRCPGAELPENQDNLIWKAASLFFKHTGLSPAVDIILEKNIPIAAGLGGGSSDAAATLSGLTALLAPFLAEEELLELGVRLGADVPFFVKQWPTALATGIGECLQPVPLTDNYHIVLVNPGFSVSTRWAYENFALTSRDNQYNLARDRKSASYLTCRITEVPDQLVNDLESVTLREFPEVAAIKQQLEVDGADKSLMSGSGPTVFGIFADYELARKSQAGFAEVYGGNAILTKPLCSGK